MPLVNFSTNIQDKDIPPNFEKNICKMLGEVLDKPVELMTLNMQTGMRQLRNNSTDPMVVLEIYSIGAFDRTQNPTYTPHIFRFFREQLRLTDDRIELIYHDLPPHGLGKLPAAK